MLKQINQKDIPDFIDPEDTITLQDLDDDFAAADLENLISELSTPDFESWNAAKLLCSY